MSQRSPLQVLFWILCLACLAVGARNFELGLSLDGPLYAAISREMARTGELIRMDGLVPDFQPYAEHPHLGFWLHALFFKILPAQDWVARMPSHLFYVGFLLLFFFWVKRMSGEWVATLAVLLLWIWPVFSNYFSNFYLDPGALFFGTAAIILFQLSFERGMPLWALFSGALLGLCTLYKGLTVLGFGPVFAYLALQESFEARKLRRTTLVFSVLCLVGFAALLGIYYFVLKNSVVPNFLEIYWQRQVSGRFGRGINWAGFLNWRFVWQLMKDTYFLLPIALLTLRSYHQHAMLPLVCLLSFYLLYAPTERIGGQYWLMTLPWVAWLVAVGIEQLLAQSRPGIDKMMRYSGRAAIVLVCIIQYGPWPTHSRRPPGQMPEITHLKKSGQIKNIILGVLEEDANFVNSASFAWYADLRVNYHISPADIPPAENSSVYLNFDKTRRADSDFTRQGWCLDHRYEDTSLWKACRS